MNQRNIKRRLVFCLKVEEIQLGHIGMRSFVLLSFPLLCHFFKFSSLFFLGEVLDTYFLSFVGNQQERPPVRMCYAYSCSIGRGCFHPIYLRRNKKVPDSMPNAFLRSLILKITKPPLRIIFCLWNCNFLFVKSISTVVKPIIFIHLSTYLAKETTDGQGEWFIQTNQPP